MTPALSPAVQERQFHDDGGDYPVVPVSLSWPSCSAARCSVSSIATVTGTVRGQHRDRQLRGRDPQVIRIPPGAGEEDVRAIMTHNRDSTVPVSIPHTVRFPVCATNPHPLGRGLSRGCAGLRAPGTPLRTARLGRPCPPRAGPATEVIRGCRAAPSNPQISFRHTAAVSASTAPRTATHPSRTKASRSTHQVWSPPPRDGSD
jgi:hypothetical protein